MSSHRQEHPSDVAPTPVTASTKAPEAPVSHIAEPSAAGLSTPRPIEVGGREGPEPTRFGDWEKRGRCIDF